MDLRAELYLRRRKSGNPNPGGMLRWQEPVCRNLLMRFCPQCGAPLLAGAKFCVECGRALDAAASGAGIPDGAARGQGRNTMTSAFMFVFVALAVFGLAAAGWIYVKTPEAVREEIASAPVSVPSSGAPSSGPGAGSPNAPAPDQNVAANPAAG